MMSPKREALDRLKRALIAHEKGRVSGEDLCRIEAEVLEVEGVKPQNVKDIKQSFRDKFVKNA